MRGLYARATRRAASRCPSRGSGGPNERPRIGCCDELARPCSCLSCGTALRARLATDSVSRARRGKYAGAPRARIRYAPKVRSAGPNSGGRDSVARASAAACGVSSARRHANLLTRSEIRPTQNVQPAGRQRCSRTKAKLSSPPVARYEHESAVGPTFVRSAARGLHVPARLTPEPTKHEARKRRASERPRVGCCEELGGVHICERKLLPVGIQFGLLMAWSRRPADT